MKREKFLYLLPTFIAEFRRVWKGRKTIWAIFTTY